MNGDPYRTPQPADRRVINRSGQAYQRQEEPQAPQDEAPAPSPKTSARSSGSRHVSPVKKSRKGLIWAIAAVLAVTIIAAGIWFAVSQAQKGATGINTSRYQAVFLVNGQIYFGKLEDFNATSFKLTNIYYPQAQTADEEGAAQNQQASGIQLIRLGEEVHGPESEMFISKDQILYYENLKEDSRVTQLINQNKS